MHDTIASDTPCDPKIYIGREISGITLIEPLGEGATGLVYTAYQKSLKRKVAIKLFLRERLASSWVEKFRTEGEIGSCS
jgi:serine/threonine protein kinase